MRPPNPKLPKYIADAIRQAWPDGVVNMPADTDDAPFWDMYPKLKARLSRLPGASLLYERQPEGESSDPEEEEAPDCGESRSYFLFFLSPTDERFKMETDTIEPDEEGVERRLQGEGWIGCVVGVSIVAPFGVATMDQLEVYEDGSRSEPDVEPHIFGLDMRKVDLEDHYREMVDDEGLEVLRKLRARIVRVLKEFEIAVIPEKYLDTPVPRLRAGGDAFVGHGEPITVRQAFFFRGP